MKTRLSEKFDLTHPVVSAPMVFAAGGKLAAAVTQAGGLGMIGGAYGDPDWLTREFANAGNARVGCGLITWNLSERPDALDQVIEQAPAALFLSFGNPTPYTAKIRDAGIPLICQVQTLRDAKAAVDAGADVIAAQGTEAGGHGGERTTMTLVPEVADWLAANAPNVLLLAAGGIADGRGLAAALMLGADGALMGSRFWASAEAQVSAAMIDAAIAASGDQSLRSNVVDVARGLNWPKRYASRVLKNAFTERWHNDLPGLVADAEAQAAEWTAGWQAGDPERANTFVGEVTGLIHDRPPASEILEGVVAEAKKLLARKWG